MLPCFIIFHQSQWFVWKKKKLWTSDTVFCLLLQSEIQQRSPPTSENMDRGMVTQTTICTIESGQWHLGISKISEGSPLRRVSWRRQKTECTRILLLPCFEKKCLFIYRYYFGSVTRPCSCWWEKVKNKTSKLHYVLELFCTLLCLAPLFFHKTAQYFTFIYW